MQREYFPPRTAQEGRGDRPRHRSLVTPKEWGEARAAADIFGTPTIEAGVGMPEDTLDAFEKARWLFVEPSPLELRGTMMSFSTVWDSGWRLWWALSASQVRKPKPQRTTGCEEIVS